MAMSISKVLVFLVLACLLISSAMAQSPAPAPFSGGGRRIISPAISPSTSKTPTPESSVASPPSLSQADSPSTDTPALTPSSISDSPAPAESPGPSQSNAISNRYAVFGGSAAVMLCAVVLAM